MKPLLLTILLLCACNGLGGDGDGNLTANCDVGRRMNREGQCVIVQNSPDNVEDIILGNNQDDILNLTNCCKNCQGNPIDGIEDSECIQACREEFNASTLNVFIEECRFA